MLVRCRDGPFVDGFVCGLTAHVGEFDIPSATPGLYRLQRPYHCLHRRIEMTEDKEITTSKNMIVRMKSYPALRTLRQDSFRNTESPTKDLRGTTTTK